MNYKIFKSFILKFRSIKSFLFIILPISIALGFFFPGASSFFNNTGISLIKLISFPAIPLVLSAVVLSIESIFKFQDNKNNKSSFPIKLFLTLIYIVFFAGIIGILVSLFIKPGLLSIEDKISIGQTMLQDSEIKINLISNPQITEPSQSNSFLQSIIPTNIISDAANSSTLKIISGSLLAGLGLAAMPNDKSRDIISLLNGVNSLSIKILEELLILSPLMLIFLIAGALSSINIQLIIALLNLALCLLVASLAFLGISKLVFKKFTSSKERNLLNSNPLDDIYVLAFSTGSSMACYPTVVKTLKLIGREPDQAEASASLSLLVARVGNIMYNIIAIFFALNLYEINISPLVIFQVLIFGITTGIATAGLIGIAVLPSVGIALTFFNVPIEPIILLIVSIDPIIQLIRVSITGVSSMALSTIVCSRVETN